MNVWFGCVGTHSLELRFLAAVCVAQISSLLVVSISQKQSIFPQVYVVCPLTRPVCVHY